MAEELEKIVDLDLLLGEPIKVKLGGQRYLLPADCPAELYLQMLRFSYDAQDASAEDELELAMPLRDGLLELFQVHQPDMERLPASMGLEMMLTAIGRIYGQGNPTPPPNGDTSGQEPGQDASPGTGKPTTKRKRSTPARKRASASSKS